MHLAEIPKMASIGLMIFGVALLERHVTVKNSSFHSLCLSVLVLTVPCIGHQQRVRDRSRTLRPGLHSQRTAAAISSGRPSRLIGTSFIGSFMSFVHIV